MTDEEKHQQWLADLRRAVWEGDLDKLQELAPCVCCCSEHTHVYCEARLWGGCRSGEEYGFSRRQFEEEWAKFYERERGMPYDQFFQVER